MRGYIMKIENGTLISVGDEDIVDGRFRLPDGVQTIGERAFLDCTSLKQLTISEGVTIGERAFLDCTSLKQLTISEGVTIGEGAFWNCTGLTQLTIPEGVTIGENAFWDCTGLTQLTISEGVEIGEGAFEHCAGLTHLTISKGVTIGKRAFWHCTGLTQLTIPEGVTIDKIAFLRCTGLTEITLNKGLVSIADSAFNDCNQLNKIWIYSDEAEFEGIKGLVPAVLQGNCELHPLYKEIEYMRKEALESLFFEPKTSDAFVIHHQPKGFFSALPSPALLEIDKFSSDESHCYRQAEKEIRSQPTPTQREDLDSYQKTLNEIIDKYRKLAEDHKHYPEPGAASSEQPGSGGGAAFS